MTLSIPIASRILPLTKTAFDNLLATSVHQGCLRAHCTRIIPPPSDDGVGDGEDESDMMHRLDIASRSGDFVIHPTEPDTVREYGGRFMTFFYHPVLSEWMNGVACGRDLGLSLRLTGSAEKMEARIVAEFFPELKGLLFSAPYAPDDTPEIRWTKPPHDPEFLRRVLPVLYRDQQHEFTALRGQWFFNMATSLGDGLFVLIGDERLLAVADHDRYPSNTKNARVLEEGRALLWEVKPEKYRKHEILVPDYFNEVVLTVIREKAGISIPIERRLFFWQTYLEGIKQSGQH